MSGVTPKLGVSGTETVEAGTGDLGAAQGWTLGRELASGLLLEGRLAGPWPEGRTSCWVCDSPSPPCGQVPQSTSHSILILV